MSSLVELAKDILRQAEALEGQMKSINEPLPTLEAGSPWCYPDSVKYPEIWTVRQSLANMSKHMLHLSLGPADTIRYMVGKFIGVCLYRLVIDFHVKARKHVIFHCSRSWTVLTYRH